jgi:SAM-dependent methyltransferase
MLALQVGVTLGILVFVEEDGSGNLAAVATLHLCAFFITAMVCHRELADSRPRAEHLTEFYLLMSVGGLLGGVFNVLLAPMLYDRVLEYPMAMIIALALRPAWSRRGKVEPRSPLDYVLPVVVFGAVSLAQHLPTPDGEWGERAMYAYLIAIGLAVASFFRRPLRLALAAAALYLGIDLAVRDDDVIYQARSFFGVYKVLLWDEYILLQHGTTTHGGQSIEPARKTEPLTYYHRQGPLGDLFRYTTDSVGPRQVALVGLGTGTTACYARPGERWPSHEIDPLVVEIARDTALFSYLHECQPDVRIALGDARLSLAAAADSSLDLIALDAFSSDAIPVHLMTREALQLYTRKLRPGGVIAFHISNRYLDLAPVLVELARDARLAGATADRDVSPAQKDSLHYGSRWVALSPSAATLAPLVREAGWVVLDPSSPARLWTDDYSDVFSAMIR